MASGRLPPHVERMTLRALGGIVLGAGLVLMVVGIGLLIAGYGISSS